MLATELEHNNLRKRSLGMEMGAADCWENGFITRMPGRPLLDASIASLNLHGDAVRPRASQDPPPSVRQLPVPVGILRRGLIIASSRHFSTSVRALLMGNGPHARGQINGKVTRHQSVAGDHGSLSTARGIARVEVGALGTHARTND